MRSRFSIRGHPLHPLLVTAPIGLLTWAFIADIVYLASGKADVWYDISFWSGVAGIVTALVAAIPGFGDYLSVALYSDARVMATAHLALNLTVVGLYAVAAAFAADEGATRGADLGIVVALHAVGVALLAVSGALGGEMVYRHHLAVIPDDAEHEVSERRHHRVPLLR